MRYRSSLGTISHSDQNRSLFLVCSIFVEEGEHAIQSSCLLVDADLREVSKDAIPIIV